jgi:hypothetical protein
MNKPLIDEYPEWVKERSWYRNTITGEASVWHPLALKIGSIAYNKADKWCTKASADRNKKTREKKI